MVKSYLRRKGLDRVDVRFLYAEGDLVMRLDRPQGKMHRRWSGPHRFVRYVGKGGLTAEIYLHNGKLVQVSSS